MEWKKALNFDKAKKIFFVAWVFLFPVLVYLTTDCAYMGSGDKIPIGKCFGGILSAHRFYLVFAIGFVSIYLVVSFIQVLIIKFKR